jgi:pimeloyl-ACP methyl ester carboxylesterase
VENIEGIENIENIEGIEGMVVEARCERLFGTVFAPGGGVPAELSPEAKLPGILFVHGLRSDQSGYRHRARMAASQLRVVCLTFDLSGHGEHVSSLPLESFSPQDHLAEVVAAYDELASHSSVDPARIGVCGASYGAYLAANLTQQRPVKRLLMRAPALFGDDEFRRPLGSLRRPGVYAPASRAVSSLAAFTGETLILESGADEVIPHEVVEAYRTACRGAQHQMIDGADHALTRPEWKEQFIHAILEFFAEL